MFFLWGGIFVQGSWDGYASSDQKLSNVKKFLSVVADMGLPGFSVKDLDEVRVPLSVTQSWYAC